MCGGQKAHRAFNQQDFETFMKVLKSAQRGENTFSTRWKEYEGGIVSLRRTGGIVSTGFAVELNFMILLYYLEEDTVRKLKG